LDWETQVNATQTPAPVTVVSRGTQTENVETSRTVIVFHFLGRQFLAIVQGAFSTPSTRRGWAEIISWFLRRGTRVGAYSTRLAALGFLFQNLTEDRVYWILTLVFGQ